MKSFYETIFLKSSSSLETKLNILKLNPKSDKEDIYMLEAGIDGENQLAYHLSKSNIGMYVLRDINLAYYDLKAQIDFIVVTSHHCYFIECKNYNADIIHIDELSNFEISTKYKGRYKKQGIKSPISQVDDQLTVFKKICLYNEDRVKELLNGVKFKDYFKTIVVFTNPNNRLNTKNAKNDIKYRVLKVDNLIRQIEYDEKHYKGNKISQEQMKNIAQFILDNNIEIKIDSNTTITEMSDNTSLKTYNNKRRMDKYKNNKNNKIALIIVIIIVAIYLISVLWMSTHSNRSKNTIKEKELYYIMK